MKQDHYIMRCAERMVKKMSQSTYRTMNGEFPNPVKIEIERMKKLCRKL